MVSCAPKKEIHRLGPMDLNIYTLAKTLDCDSTVTKSMDFRQNYLSDFHLRGGDDRWREREEERRMGGGSRERDWGRTEGKAGPSFATYTPIWSAVPSRCDSS